MWQILFVSLLNYFRPYAMVLNGDVQCARCWILLLLRHRHHRRRCCCRHRKNICQVKFTPIHAVTIQSF